MYVIELVKKCIFVVDLYIGEVVVEVMLDVVLNEFVVVGVVGY